MINNNMNNNYIRLKIPYEYLVTLVSIFSLSLISILYYLNNKLYTANENICALQKQSDSINKILEELQNKNENLLVSLADLKYKNFNLEQMLSDMKNENISLLNTISELRTNLSLLENNASIIPSTTIVNSDILLKMFFGTLALGIITYGGFSLVTLITTKYANSSIGLLISGMDKKLIWLGEKVKLIDTPAIEKTLVDQFSNSFKIEFEGNKIIDILIEKNGTFTNLGEHIKEFQP